jgi:hypothetical protein
MKQLLRLRWLGLGLLLMLTPTFPIFAQGPELKLLEPMNDETIMGSTFPVIFQVSGIHLVPSTVPLAEAGKHPEANRPGEGHLHLMLDLQPVVVWTETTPYRFTDVPSGPHLLSVEVVQNDHSSLTPPVIVQLKITVENATAPSPTPALMPNTGLSSHPGDLYVSLLGALILLGSGGMVRRRARLDQHANVHDADTILLRTLLCEPSPSTD